MEQNKAKQWLRVALLLSLVMVAGCWQRSVKVNLISDPKLNTSVAQKSLPVVVRVYQLSDPCVFEKSSFQELWKKDKTLLGDSLLAHQELVLSPKSTKRVRFSKKEAATHIGVMALFREPGKYHWKGITPIKRGIWAKRVTAKFKGNVLTIN